jgi:hypothetical protein
LRWEHHLAAADPLGPPAAFLECRTPGHPGGVEHLWRRALWLFKRGESTSNSYVAYKYKLCAAITIAKTLVHEVGHTCARDIGLNGRDEAGNDEHRSGNCDPLYRLSNIWAYGVMIRYGDDSHCVCIPLADNFCSDRVSSPNVSAECSFPAWPF